MYRVIVYDGPNDQQGTVLHEPKNFGNKILSGQGSVNLQFNAISTAQFQIPMQNTLYRQLQPITTLIKVFDTQENKVVYDGRVAKITGEFSGAHSQTLECEDCLAFLHDSTQTYRKVQNTTIAQFFKTIIDYHNSQVEPYKQFKVGRVTVTNSTDNVYRYTDDAQDTFDTIKDKLIDRLGGYIIWYRDAAGQLIIEYLASYGDAIETPIMLGKNLKSAKREFDVSELITRLVPVGAVIEQTGEEITAQADAAQPKVTIESVNNGVRYLEDADLVKKFGIIQKSVEWTDVNVASILKTKGQEYLRQQRVGLLSWTVDVIDISSIDSSYKSFELGNSYPIIDSYLNAIERLQVTTKKFDVTRPHTMTLQIGTQNKTLSQFQLEYQAAMTYLENQKAQTAQSLDAMKNQLETLKKITNKIPDQEVQIAELEKRIAELEGTASYYEGAIIDVSYYQGSINWTSVKNAGLALGIVRVQDGTTTIDANYKTYLADITNLGLNYAVYAFFRGQSIADSEQEAVNFYNRTQQAVAGKTQPRFYAIDVETIEMGGSASQMKSGVEAYMNKLNELGIPDSKIVLYIANNLYASLNLNVSRAGSVWLPTYGANDGSIPTDYKPGYPYDLWQYTSVGKISGITGNVDMSTAPSSRFKEQYLKK